MGRRDGVLTRRKMVYRLTYYIVRIYGHWRLDIGRQCGALAGEEEERLCIDWTGLGEIMD